MTTAIHPIRLLRSPVLKRGFDVVAAGAALVAASVPMLLVAVLIRLVDGGPVLFRQERPGRGGRIFVLYKFRTMQEARDEDGSPLPDAVRLTRLGRFLRSTSLDEMPELWNVLKGDMSVVGPRPLLTRYLDRYTPEQARRHEVPPGLTGWAQINGRNTTPWPERFRQDVWYVDHWDLLLDLRILAGTVGMVFRREGITQSGRATVDYFGEG